MKKKHSVEPVVEDFNAENLEAEEVTEVQEEVTHDDIAEPLTAIVVGCKLLNLRESPDGDVITTLKENETVQVVAGSEINGYVEAYTGFGISGFVMKKYLQFS